MFENIDIERKEFLREASTIILKRVRDKYHGNFDHQTLIQCSLYLYKRCYGNMLSDYEKSYFSLLIMIPDDISYYKTCKCNMKPTDNTNFTSSINRYDFKKIANIYGVNQNIAILRYKQVLDGFRNNLLNEEEYSAKSFKK